MGMSLDTTKATCRNMGAIMRKMTLMVAFVEGPDGEVIEFCKAVVPTI